MEEQSKPLDAGELFIGMCDALMTFGVVFANAGIFTREQLAEECARSIQHIRTQRALQGLPPSAAREMALDMMRRLFSATVIPGGCGRVGLIPIQGGKADDGSPPGAA
jgi:hypothetical protein